MDPRANGSFGNGRFGNGSTITLRANRDIAVNDLFNVDTATGATNVNLVLEANRHIDISANLTTTGSATITADANATGPGDFTLDSNATLSTTNSNLQITTRNIDITNGTINTGAGTATILSSNGGNIRLGDGGGNLVISGAELQNISAANLVIGDNTNSNITVDNITAANSNNITGTVTLNATAATRAITFQNNASTFNALTANAGDDINVNIGLFADTGTLSLSANNDVTIGALGSVTTTGAANNVNIVVDNQFPATPLLGAGRFVNNGAVVAAGRFLIYSVQASQNTLGTLVPPNQQFSTYFGDVVNFAGSGILFKVAAPVVAAIAAVPSAVASVSSAKPDAEVFESLPLQIIELFISSYNRIQELYQSSEYDYKKRVGKVPYNTFYVSREKTEWIKEPMPNRVGPFSLSTFETFYQKISQKENNKK